VSAGGAMDSIQKTELAEADAHDTVFDDVDLNWWK
jgi:hypothetical protein